MSDLIGAEVEFKILALKKNQGRIGTVKKVMNTAVIVEGKDGSLHNRHIGEIVILEARR